MPELSEKDLTDLISELDYFKAKVSKLITIKPKKQRKQKINAVQRALNKRSLERYGKIY